MANERTMAAESVSNVLELARMRRQSGLLTIEQYNGGRIQKGEIYLQAGQPVYIRLGPLVGQEALTRLLSWRNVQFTLQLDEAGTAPLTPVGKNTGNDASRANTPAPGLEWLTPQKRDEGRDFLSLPLTRRQRFIYFLVDGRRTMSDLARCTGKNIQEVELILRELQDQGLVNI